MKQKRRSIRALITVAAAVIMMMAMSITSFAASKVTGLKQTASGTGYVTFTWNVDASASKYNVYIATSKNGTYNLKGSTYSTQYTISGLNSGSAYYVKVAAVASNGRVAEKSLALQVVTNPSSINSSTIKQCAATASGINLKWDAVKGASGYMVYEGSKKLKTVTKASAVMKSAKGASHYYTVYPYKKSNSGYIAKGTSTGVRGYSLPGKMEKLASVNDGNISWDPETNEVRVKWNLPAGTKYYPDGYQVEVYSVSGKSKIKSYTLNSGYSLYKDFVIGTVKNKGFQVRVRGFIVINEKKYYGEWSSKKVVVPAAACNKTVSFPSSGTMKFSWKPVSGATKYYIYVANNQSSSISVSISDLKKVATVSSGTTSYTASGLTKGKYAAVCVVPVIKVNGKEYAGLKSPYVAYIR